MIMAVEIKDLSKVYPGKVVLDRLTFSIARGKLVMVVGPSGCGKTTLISIIAGVMNQSSGSCKVLGEDLSHKSNLELTKWRRANLGFVFQSFNLFPTLSAAENAAFPLLVNGIKRNKALSLAKDYLYLLGIGDQSEKLPNQLSGGQQQRVAFVRGLIHNPPLIICDEPTSALDSSSSNRALETLKTISLSIDSTVLVVTHDLEITKYADQIIRMNQGKITSVEYKQRE